MVERYPAPGGLVIAAGGDAVAFESAEEPRIYLLLDRDIGFNVTPFIEASRAWIDTAAIPVAGWLEGPPLIEARASRSVSRYAEWLSSRLRRQGVSRLRVLLGLSGGKDSTAALLVLEELQEYIDVRYRAVYVHIPFLEPPRNISHVEYIARTTGAPVEVVEASRHWVKSMLKWRGLPRRGDRWCTVAKVKPMRRIMKSDGVLVEAVADRPAEAPKRLRRLWRQLTSLNPLAGRRLRPVLWLTLADVIDYVRHAGLTHPDYLEGMQRVACLACPYRSLHEFPPNWLDRLEDPGLILEAARKRWRRDVRHGRIPFSLYMEQNLWRYPGDMAVKLAAVKLSLSSSMDAEAETSMAGRAARAAAIWAWSSTWPLTQPVIGPEGVAELLSRAPASTASMSPEGPRGLNAAYYSRAARRRGGLRRV